MPCTISQSAHDLCHWWREVRKRLSDLTRDNFRLLCVPMIDFVIAAVVLYATTRDCSRERRHRS